MKNNSYLFIRGGAERYEILDFLKGFSIFTIVLMHLIQIFISMCPRIVCVAASLGGTGVHVFIFCSGFGLYYARLKKGDCSVLEFVKNRFIKVYFPYIVIILVSSIFPYMYHGEHRIVALLSHLFLFKMFLPAYESSFGTQFWYISTIIQLYFIFIPLCKIIKYIGCKKNFILSFCISFSWWLFVFYTGKSDIRIWSSFFLQYLWEFSFGVLIAEFLHDGNSIIINNVLLAIVAFIGIFLEGFFALKGGLWQTFNDIPALLGYGAFALILYSLFCGRTRFNRLICVTGRISYAWYLVHIFVFTTFFYFFHATNLLGQLFLGSISFFVSYLIAIFYNRLVAKVFCKNHILYK